MTANQARNAKVYRISLAYRATGTSRFLSMYHEYVRVHDDETISDVIQSVKEKMFYNWEDAPLIENVNYNLHIENAPY